MCQLILGKITTRFVAPLALNVKHYTMKSLCIAMAVFLVSATAFCAQGNEIKKCDEYMKTKGGPCLIGVPLGSKIRPGFIPDKHRIIKGFKIGRDSFNQAKKIFGVSEVWHSGDAAAAETKICYEFGRGANIVTVVLAMDDEMSDRIDEIRFIKGEIDTSAHCKNVKENPAVVKTDSGIHVGMSENKIIQILGTPTNKNGGIWSYMWKNDRELKPKDSAYSMCLDDGKSIVSLLSGLDLRIKNGVVVWLSIGYGDYTC